MAVLNSVTIEGRLFKDFENGALRTSSNGNKFISFGVAVYQGQNVSPMFVNVTAFSYDAEKVAKCGKGTSLIIHGVLSPSVRDGKQTGVQVLANCIVVVPKVVTVKEEPAEEAEVYPWDR